MNVIQVLDRSAEDTARTLASTQSRRSFLGRFGKMAVVLTGAGLIETTTATPAAAHHVCGHTGTSPTCNNNPYPNCNSGQTKGGCWGACCCSPRLRFLCDCCVPRCSGCGTCSCCGQAHGYCPSGMCVKCIVYGCGQQSC